MAKRRLLPQYVTSFKDRHGKERLRFRRTGFKGGYFNAPLGTEEFRVEYRAFMKGGERTVEEAVEKAAPGSVNELVTRYLATPTRLGPTEVTQAKVRRIIDGFRRDHGNKPVALIEFQHVEAILAAKLERTMEKTPRGMRPVGGPEAARKLRKELVRLFDFAIRLKMIGINPAAQADRVKVAPADRSKGFYTWTEDDIAKYRAHHKLGSKARLAMELMLWTDQRRIDSIHLGRQHIRDGYLHLTQTKTGKEMILAVAPQLLEAIVAMSPRESSPMCFLLNEWGKPFTNASFGNKMRDWCDAAGLPQCTAHGLRKATMRRMAELEMGNQQMKAVSGHTKDDEVARYTAQANQKRLAKAAISRLSQWEMSNLAERLDIGPAKTG